MKHVCLHFAYLAILARRWNIQLEVNLSSITVFFLLRNSCLDFSYASLLADDENQA